MVTLQTTKTKGGMFQKIRILGHSSRSPLDTVSIRLRSPSQSSSEVLTRRLHPLLVWSVPEKDVAQPQIHGIWIPDLPRRFGSSEALDNAALCFVSSYEAAARGGDASRWMDLKQYSKTTRSLQKAMTDPTEQFSMNTITAVCLLWRLE